MKIAVVTTSYANNYGALLQTYALQRFLNENMSHDALALDYTPPWNSNTRRLFIKPKSIKDILVNAYMLLHIKNYILSGKRVDANNKFRDEYIKMSDEKFFSEEDLKAIENEYDCLICGSDQIWNIDMRADKMPHPAFFLQFAKDWQNVRKVAYAPSVADPVPEGAKKTLASYLETFDALSVREISDVEPLQHLTDKKVHHVLDPVFLLSKKQWSDVASPAIIKEKYILCYFLTYGTFSHKVVDKLRKLTGYKVVNININRYDKFNSDKVIWDAGPQDFVSLIKNAEFVCTNSFHCTAFSIIFRKNFVVLNKGWASSRMQSLQKVLGIDDRFVSEEWVDRVTTEMLTVDYSEIENKMQKKIDESINYLKEALDEKRD